MQKTLLGRSILLVVTMLFATYALGQQVIQTNSAVDLIPEGIAVDSITGNIYVTSIAKKKIIVVASSGATHDFITSGRSGFLEGLGIKVDYKRRWLWAVSNSHQGTTYTSRIHAFDIVSSKTMASDEITGTEPHLFNDIAIGDGAVYISDSEGRSVYRYSSEAKQFARTMHSDDLKYANGIALKKDLLYVASNNGLTIFDLRSESHHLITTATMKYCDGLDGLVLYKNSLIGIYNLPDADRDMAVVRFGISNKGQEIEDVAVIDSGNKHFHAPTTAAVSGNFLFVLANSHLLDYNANKESTKGIVDRLSSVTILTYQLK